MAGTAALVAIAGPAWASGPYTVAAGGTTAGTANFIGVTTGYVPPVHLDVVTMSVSCDSSTMTGDINLGISTGGMDIADINTTTWNNCQGPVSLQITHVGTWSFNATGTPGAVIEGTVTGAHLRAVALNPSTGLPDPTLCSFDVTGTVDVSFDQTLQQMAVPSSSGSTMLTASNVVGCFGLLADGDPAGIEATYAIASSPGAITIS